MIVLSSGLVILGVYEILKDVLGNAANTITDKVTDSVSKTVSDGVKDLRNKIASILPGLLGAIAKFVFNTAGEVISFLGKNAWLLILAVAAFIIERLSNANVSINTLPHPGNQTRQSNSPDSYYYLIYMMRITCLCVRRGIT